MSKKLYEELNCPNNSFKTNQQLLDLTFDQSLLLLCNDETGKSGLHHMSHFEIFDVTHITCLFKLLS